MRLKIVLVAIISFLLLCSTPSFSKTFKVFMVQSYSNDDLCGIPQLKGAIDTLKQANLNEKNLKLHIFFMETKTKNTTKAQIKAVGEKAYQEIKSIKPDIVMLFDDAAFMELAPKLINTKCKVVFSGINKPLEDYNKTLKFMDKDGFPTRNITGVYEKLHIYESIEFIESVLKKQGNIALISSTDVIGKIIEKQIFIELKNTKFAKTLHPIIHVNNTKEFISALNTINNDKKTIAYILNTESISSKKHSINLNMFDSIPIALKYAKKPDIALNSYFCKNGLFGGVSVDFYSMGAQAAQLAIKILNGVPIQKLKIEYAEKTIRTININRANQLHIKIPVYVINSLNAVY